MNWVEDFAARRRLLFYVSRNRRLREQFEKLVALCRQSIDGGGKVIFFGNGGSAAQAQHFAAELMVHFEKNRPPIPALALTTDTSVLTATANDYGYNDSFMRQAYALCNPGDVAVGLTTSGQSANVMWGLAFAKSKGAVAAAMTGENGGLLVGTADPLIEIPSKNTAHVQEVHLALGHLLCRELEGSWKS